MMRQMRHTRWSEAKTVDCNRNRWQHTKSKSSCYYEHSTHNIHLHWALLGYVSFCWSCKLSTHSLATHIRFPRKPISCLVHAQFAYSAKQSFICFIVFPGCVSTIIQVSNTLSFIHKIWAERNGQYRLPCCECFPFRKLNWFRNPNKVIIPLIAATIICALAKSFGVVREFFIDATLIPIDEMNYAVETVLSACDIQLQFRGNACQ